MPISSRESSRAHSDAPAVVLRPLARADRGSGAGAERGSGAGAGADRGSGAGADRGSGAGADRGSGADADRGSGAGADARADRDAIEKILRATKAFREDEIVVAMELIDADESEGYRFVVAEVEGDVAGYACYGATPLTIGTWDLYWIAVDPGMQGRRIGHELFDAALEAVRADGGRMLLIETGGKASYGATRNAYLAWGCVEVARVPDFYERGDDKVVYARYV